MTFKKSTVAYRGHRVRDGQRASEVAALVEHIGGNPLHTAADSECGGGATFERLGVFGKVGAIDGVVFHLREARAVLESARAYRGHASANGQRAREAAASLKSGRSYRGHGIRDGQRAIEIGATIESIIANLIH